MAPGTLSKRTSSQASFGPAPRQEPPTPSSVSTAATQEDFRRLLDELRNALGLSYTQIGARGGKGMGRSTAHAVITKDCLPSREHVTRFLQACKVPPAERTVWLQAWNRLDNTSAPPANETETTAATDSLQAPTANTTPPGVAAAPREHHDETKEPGGEPETTAATSDHLWPAVANGRLPLAMLVRTLAALAVTTVTISGSAIAMWLLHVPIEVVVLVYALVAVCVAAWLSVTRAWISAALIHAENHGDSRPGLPRFMVEPDPDGIFGPLERTAPPVIG